MKNRRIAIYTSILLSSIVSSTLAQAASSEENEQGTKTAKTITSTNALETIKTVVQISFWLTIAAVAILTYRQARKTVLQPIRTEVFKAQIAEMSKALALLVGKDEHDLRKDFSFDKALHVNTCSLFDSYRYNFFDVEIDIDKRPYNPTECPLSNITHKHLQPADEHILTEETNNKKKTKPDSRVRAVF